jgi:hypothetical protein
MSQPAEAVLWDMLYGALATRVLGVAAELGVADALARGPRAVADIATDTGADADMLYRSLRALASDGIFEETKPGVFRNTAASELLKRGSGWKDFAELFGGIWHRTAGELDANGEPTFERLFGADFWAWLAEHPKERASFDRAMEQGKERRLERLANVEWRGDETVVDVGGGNGSFLRELLEHQPGLRGIVFDLPETVRDESAFGDRLKFVAGSFFERVPEGDVYVLSTILHDWDDERAEAILGTIRAAAPNHARLLVLDRVLQPGNEPDGMKWLDLLMLVLLGGRERDEAQWRALLERGGFRVDRLGEALIEASCL